MKRAFLRDRPPALAFDRSSVRSIDKDGRLHVATNNISKATVSPYYGHEIPGCEALGLDPNTVYHLLRCPDELAKAASTFNNLPILGEHVPVSADAHMPELVIGSTGTDATFADPYLQNSAVVWVQSEIDLIEHEDEDQVKREWSCGYRYDPDMTSGVFRGLRYDGVMRNIVGNHVALVHEGRAGPDVMVGDSRFGMGTMLKSRRAVMLSGALSAFIAPKLAADAKLSFAGALDGVTAANLDKRRDKIAAAIVGLAKPKLAADEGLDIEDVVEVIQAVQGIEPDADDVIADPVDDKTVNDDDGGTVSRIMAFLEGKLSDEDMASIAGMIDGDALALDEKDDDKNKGKSAPAMDEGKIRADITAKVRADMLAIQVAERAVEPHVGAIKVAMDSASAVYRLALDAAKVSTTGVHPSAFAAMVAMLPLPGGRKPIVTDADIGAHRNDFDKRFPNRAKLVRG